MLKNSFFLGFVTNGRGESPPKPTASNLQAGAARLLPSRQAVGM